jgi:hypothetical protein
MPHLFTLSQIIVHLMDLVEIPLNDIALQRGVSRLPITVKPTPVSLSGRASREFAWGYDTSKAPSFHRESLVALSSMAGCQLLVSFNGVAETNLQCDDNIDNDQDGRTDCDDPSCTGSVKCGGIGGDGGSVLFALMTIMDVVVVKDSVMNHGGSTNFDQDLMLPPLPLGTNCTTAGRFGNAARLQPQAIYRTTSQCCAATTSMLLQRRRPQMGPFQPSERRW